MDKLTELERQMLCALWRAECCLTHYINDSSFGDPTREMQDVDLALVRDAIDAAEAKSK